MDDAQILQHALNALSEEYGRALGALRVAQSQIAALQLEVRRREVLMEALKGEQENSDNEVDNSEGDLVA